MSAVSPVSRIAELKAQQRKPGEASFFYYDPNFQFDAVKVLPGEYFVSEEDLLIVTVLGSCIAACIWDTRAQVGGMNHFMLPDGDGDGGGRYGSYAMELLINEMAPRVHNSGHWTIEGAVCSQFENHIRAICGLPLGDTALTAPEVGWP